MRDKERPSRSRGRKITEAEIDMRSHDEQVKRWKSKLYFDVSKQSVDEIAQELLRKQKGKSERSS